MQDNIKNTISDILNVRDQHTQAKCKSTSHAVKGRKTVSKSKNISTLPTKSKKKQNLLK